ncbi:MAG: quinoprotein dehydrogenase-associated SoxYZ-like carrier [Pseudomonadota bacterium]
MKNISVIATLLAGALIAGSAAADGAPPRESEAWPGLHAALWDDKEIAAGDSFIQLDTPVRAADAAIVPIEIRITPETGRRVAAMTILVEENPAPVAAEFTFGEAMGPDITLSTRLRVDQYSNVRVVAELDDGSLHQVAHFVKASGGCSAPATKDADAALAALGKMKMRRFEPKGLPAGFGEAQVMVRHPQNSGFQIDQVTLLHIPAFFIEEMSVTLDDANVFTMTGGISISEDPALRFVFRENGAEQMHVTSIDTDGGIYHRSFELGTGS